MLSNIREFWIALAQERRSLSEDDLAAEIETIGRLQDSLTAPSANKIVHRPPRRVADHQRSGSHHVKVQTGSRLLRSQRRNANSFASMML
jgi:hypothetical protein